MATLVRPTKATRKKKTAAAADVDESDLAREAMVAAAEVRLDRIRANLSETLSDDEGAVPLPQEEERAAPLVPPTATDDSSSVAPVAPSTVPTITPSPPLIEPSPTRVPVVPLAPPASPTLVVGTPHLEVQPAPLPTTDVEATPLLLGTSRARLTLEHVHVDRAYNLQQVRLAQTMASSFLTEESARPGPSRFRHYVAEYVKSEKLIDELIDGLEVLKGDVNRRVADLWVLRTKTDVQTRSGVEETEGEFVEASVKYLDASMRPEVKADLDQALARLRRARTTDLSRAVYDRHHTQLWAEQTIDSSDNSERYLYVVDTCFAFLRSLTRILAAQNSVSAAPYLKGDRWPCRAARTITAWARHASAWLLRFGTRADRLDIVLQLTHMPGIGTEGTNEVLGHRALLGALQFPLPKEPHGIGPVPPTPSDLVAPVPLDGSMAMVDVPLYGDSFDAPLETRDPWASDALLDHFVAVLAIVLYRRPGNVMTVECIQPDILNNRPLTDMVTRASVNSLVDALEVAGGRDNVVSKISVDIFNVGTGTGTESTNWNMVGEDSVNEGPSIPLPPSPRHRSGPQSASPALNDVSMSDDDMVALYEQLPIGVACKALFSPFRVQHTTGQATRLAFARAASVIRLHGQALYEFATTHPRFCKILAETMVHIVAESTVRVDVSGDAAALIESLCLLTVHELQRCPARQVRLYLTRLPYHTCSPALMWRVMLAVYLGTESAAVRFAGIGEPLTGGENVAGAQEGEPVDDNHLFLCAIREGIYDRASWHRVVEAYPEIRLSLVSALGETTTFNECARLATLGDIAEAHGGDIAAVIFEELFYVGHVAVESRSIWHTQIVSFLVNMSLCHPQLISIAVRLMHAHMDSDDDDDVPVKSLVYLARHLERPLGRWCPAPGDLDILGAWLAHCPSAGVVENSHRAIASTMLDHMNWGSAVDEERLFLPLTIHREASFILAEAMLAIRRADADTMAAHPSTWADTLSRQLWTADADKFEAWAFERLQSLCLYNYYIEKKYPRVVLTASTNPAPRVLKLWATQLAALKEMEPVAAYVLLLTTDALHRDGGWGLWACLVEKNHLLPALRVLHDVSHILHQHPAVLARIPQGALKTMATLHESTLSLSFAGFTTVPYGVRVFASMVASQSEYGHMWLGASGAGILGEYGDLFVMEALLDAGVRGATERHLAPLDSAVAYMDSALLKKQETENDQAQSQPSSGISGQLLETFMGWGKVGVGLLSLFGNGGPSHPNISFFTLVLSTWKQSELLACMSRYFDDHAKDTCSPGDPFYAYVERRVLVGGEEADKTLWNEIGGTAYFESAGDETLAVFAWADLCLTFPVEESLLPVVWQCFFALYLSQLKDASPQATLGPWLVGRRPNLMAKLCARLTLIIDRFEGIAERSDEQPIEPVDGDEHDMFAEDTSHLATVTALPTAHGIAARNLATHFRGMMRWLHDTAHVECRALHQLPPLYCPDRLASLVDGANPFSEHHSSAKAVLECLWWDTVASAVKVRGSVGAEIAPAIDWMPYSRPQTVLHLPPRHRKYRATFDESSIVPAPPYRTFQPTLPMDKKLDLTSVRPEVYTSELVELAKRYSKMLSATIDLDNQITRNVSKFWVKTRREMRRRENDSKGRTYEFVFRYMDSGFNKDALSKAKSLGVVCDERTLKMAESERGGVDKHGDRCLVDEYEASSATGIVSMMTIEIVVDQLERSTFDVFTVDQISSWFYQMLKCDRDNECWTRKCEYTRDFIWRIVKRLANLWLKTGPSIDDRNHLLLLLTESIPASATSAHDGPVFSATMGILQELLKMHFDDHLPYVLQVLVGSDAEGVPMNDRVWQAVINIPKWPQLNGAEECSHMLGAGVMRARIRRRDNHVATLTPSHTRFELTNDLFKVWPEASLDKYLHVAERLFRRLQQSNPGATEQAFRHLFDPWFCTLTMPADEELNRQAILQHPWPLNGDLNRQVETFLSKVLTRVVSDDLPGWFLAFLWEWIAEHCTPLEFTGEVLCKNAMEHVKWSDLRLDVTTMGAMTELLRAYRSDGRLSWMARLTVHALSQVDWPAWCTALLHSDAQDVSETLQGLLELLVLLEMGHHFPAASIGWEHLSVDHLYRFLQSELLVDECTGLLIQAASFGSSKKFSVYLTALGTPLGSAWILSSEYVRMVDTALDMVRTREYLLPGTNGDEDEEVIRTVLSWVDHTILTNKPATDGKETSSMREQIGRRLWRFFGDAGELATAVLANATVVLSLPFMAIVNERALLALKAGDRHLADVTVDLPSLKKTEFVDACVEEGCSLTLYKVASQMDEKQASATMDLAWNKKTYTTLHGWLTRLSSLDERALPLLQLCVSKTDPFNAKAVNGIVATAQLVQTLHDRSRPSLIARVGKFIAGATFGEGAAPPTKLSLALTEMLNAINEYIAQGSQGNFETFLERVALCKDTK